MRRVLVSILGLFLLGCGGSSSSSSGVTLSGVAATGAPIDGSVFAKDALSHEVSASIRPNGRYSLDVRSLTFPILLKAEWVSGGVTHRLYSFALLAGRANVTPLTDLALSSAAGGDDLLALYESPSAPLFAALSSHLPGAISKLRAALKPLLDAYGADADPFAADFSADHTGIDKFFDEVAITRVGGSVDVTSRATGALRFSAPVADLDQGLSALGWSSAEALVANDPFVAVDPAGRGLVLWYQSATGHSDIYAKWLDGGVAAVRLSDGTGYSSAPKVAFDGSGNALAVWSRYDGGPGDIWARRYAVGGGWGDPQRISSVTVGYATGPEVSCDSAGNALAVWSQWSGQPNHFDVYFSRFTVSSATWTVPALLSDGVNSAYGARLAGNRDGKALAVWSQDQGDGSESNGPKDTLARSYASAGGWGAAVRLNSLSGATNEVYGQTAVAMDLAGNATALWVQQDGAGPYAIWANRYSSSDGWGGATVIANDVIDACYSPDVVIDAAGASVAVWEQQDGLKAFTVANQAPLGGAWGTSQTLSDDTGDCYDPHVAVDAAGNATAVWYQTDPTEKYTIRESRRAAGGAWSAPLLLDTPDLPLWSTFPAPRVATNAIGKGYVIWGVFEM